MKQPFLDEETFFKSKELPIGTVSKGRKKVAKGKWVKIKKKKVSKFNEDWEISKAKKKYKAVKSKTRDTENRAFKYLCANPKK